MLSCLNLRTQAESYYHGPTPREAVIAAYAQSRGDWNTWDYHKNYDHLVEVGRHHFFIGDWGCKF